MAIQRTQDKRGLTRTMIEKTKSSAMWQRNESKSPKRR